MNFVDLLLVLLVLAITATGLFQGTIRTFIAVIALYAGIVLSSLYFRFLAVFFLRRGTSTPVAEAVSFFLLLTVCFILLFTATTYTFRYVRITGRLEFIDHFFGLLLGFVLALMVAAALSMVLHYAFVRYNPAIVSNLPLTGSFQNSVRSSRVMELVLAQVVPRLYTSMAPFIPEAALAFFRPEG